MSISSVPGTGRHAYLLTFPLRQAFPAWQPSFYVCQLGVSLTSPHQATVCDGFTLRTGTITVSKGARLDRTGGCAE